MIFEECPGTEKSVFIGTLSGRDDTGQGREVTELGLESCDEREPRGVVENGIENT